MAKMTVSGLDAFENTLGKMDRETVKRLMKAGTDACIDEMRKITQEYGHVRTGSLMEGITAGKLVEDLGGAWQEVYPQGTDSRGVSNAKKAFVINYGRGKKLTMRTGDKFITGNKKRMEDVVTAAMKAEADRILQEINGG